MVPADTKKVRETEIVDSTRCQGVKGFGLKQASLPFSVDRGITSRTACYVAMVV